MIDTSRDVRGTAAGVPFLAVPPAGDRESAPVVVAWHQFDAPCTESAFAAAIPLDGLDAWRVYLGLPMHGSRLPAAGADELMRLGYEDAVRNLHVPIPKQAAGEFPAAFAALRERLGLGDGPVGLVGASAGASTAQLVLVNGAGPRIAAAVLISSIHELKAIVDALGRRYGTGYAWDPESLALVAELDFVARAGEVAASGAALRIVVGAEDDAEGILDPAARMHAALPGSDLVTVEGMAHALADAPGTEAAPQLPHATAVDALAVEWLRERLVQERAERAGRG